MQMGSHGKTVFQGLEYYEGDVHQPIAPCHTLWLGPIKDYLGWVVQRLGSGGDSRGEPLPCAFKNPTWLKDVVAYRLKHVVLRSVTACTLVDFTQHLNSMIINEAQLMVEVALPYIMLDWVAFGVPEEVVLVGCECLATSTRVMYCAAHMLLIACRLLLRHSVMKLTRLHGIPSRALYEQDIQDARAAGFAAMVLLQTIHGEQVWSMPATMKAHLITHLADQALTRCHASGGNTDMWVERLMRTGGTRWTKCVPAMQPSTL